MATLSGLFRELVGRRASEVDFPAVGRLIEDGRLDEAEARLAGLGRLADAPYARLLRARLHRERGEYDAARPLLEAALAQGEVAAARLELAALSRALGDRAAERRHYEALLQVTPDAPHVLNNLGLCLVELGDPDAAVPLLERTLAAQPAFASARVNLARALLECGRYAESLEHERRLLEADPQATSTRFRIAHLQLLTGEVVEGWRGYELRREHPAYPRLPLPAWDGSDPRGRRLFVYGEQGLGDVFLFARFLPLLVDRGATVVFKCRPTLERLLQASFTHPAIAVRKEVKKPEEEAEMHAPLLSLPYLLELGAAAIRPVAPYLRPDTELTARWRGRMQGGPGLRIGLVWAGNPERRWDETRSMPAEVAAPLAAARPDALWFSLQVPRGELPFAMHDLMGEVADYADTAAIIAALDLVITVDTSVAHCAAAMGKPVWLLAPRAPCWRWLVGDRPSPWYDTVRMFRPAHSRDWAPVIAEVARALPAFGAG